MGKLKSLERRHVSLKGSCRLLQTRQRQVSVTPKEHL